MVGIANVCGMKVFCKLSDFVENNNAVFIINNGGKIKGLKRCVRYSRESKALYVNINGTRIFYEDFE